MTRSPRPVAQSAAGHFFRGRITACVCLVLALLVGWSSAMAASSPDVVRIGYQKGSILTLLKARGTLDATLKKRGIDVRWVEFAAGPQMLEAINVGSIDFATVGDAPPIFAQAAGADLVYISRTPANPQTEAILLPPDSSIHSIADLKGRRIALNKGSDVNYLVAAALERAGLKYSDIKPRYLTPSDARAAFGRGDIDAWAVWDPYYAEAQANAGARVLTDAQDIVPHYSFYLSSRTFAERHPDIVTLFNHDVADLCQWTPRHAMQAADILSRATGLSPAVWRKTIARHDYGLEPMSPSVFKAQQKLADTFYDIGLIPKPVTVAAARWQPTNKSRIESTNE
ncbi:sulfonate ABC transporter substrate-binding protein [Salinisphaera sp. Q1T1-3]|uniref:sulfonate ABC transporter substrate-binding protein n=1 Tax=Salinisphaera sp. Q1T1-3 TaxID=2321229 RepID=UPI000E72C562|nr:sulfonate ABC transporter substrate-binding protein [Salinisphaera sp. Q1T1-3]RJS95131.1 sulfonate ABC transporter substrate-binding protein [Salinisphaera sp. Q1T1-3]